MLKIKKSNSKTIYKTDRALELIDEAHSHLQEAQEYLTDYYGNKVPVSVENNVIRVIDKTMEMLESILVDEDL